MYITRSDEKDVLTNCLSEFNLSLPGEACTNRARLIPNCGGQQMRACADLLSLFVVDWLSSVQPVLELFSTSQLFLQVKHLSCLDILSYFDLIIMVKGKQVQLSTVLAAFWLRKVEKLTYPAIGKAFQRGEKWARRQVQKVGFS